MSSLINDTIREILMDEQQVCLPGIGTLRLNPQPAVVSPIEGRVVPPSQRATFNSNLVLDDGRILRSLQEIPVLTAAEAEALLNGYLRDIRDNLDGGRSVTVEGVGRLFKHFDGEVRFTAAGENFSKESFGLPAVELKPVVRSEKQRRAVADPILGGATGGTTTADPPPVATKPAPNRWQQFIHHPDLKPILWYIAAALATVAILILGYLALRSLAGVSDEAPLPRRERPPVVVEEPPRRQPLPPVDADRVVPDEPPRLGETSQAQPEQRQPAPTPVPDRTVTPDPATSPPAANPPVEANSPYNTAFIATGLYGSSANVTKNMNRITKLGYEAFSRREGRYTRVGVRVQYTTRPDLIETLRALQRRYDDAYVMEINGEAVRID